MGAQQDLARSTAYIIRGRNNPSCKTRITRKAPGKASTITRKVIYHHVLSYWLMTGRWYWQRWIWVCYAALLCERCLGYSGTSTGRKTGPYKVALKTVPNCIRKCTACEWNFCAHLHNSHGCTDACNCSWDFFYGTASGKPRNLVRKKIAEPVSVFQCKSNEFRCSCTSVIDFVEQMFDIVRRPLCPWYSFLRCSYCVPDWSQVF
jgi:hypothetical protein